jgi:hypothetical protein
MIKVKAEIKLLSAELGKGREGELKVKAGLSSGVKSHNMWALIALNSKQRLV